MSSRLPEEDFIKDNPFVFIKKSCIHGYGVFARTFIPRGSRIIEYLGRRISKKESELIAEEQLRKHSSNPDEGAVYIFSLNKKWDLDGNVPWNPARLINHSCSPNCEAVNDGHHIWIVALRNISEGEEITYNYGYDVDNFEDHPCFCGSDNCVGYIVAEDQWDELKRILNKRKKKFEEKKIIEKD